MRKNSLLTIIIFVTILIAIAVNVYTRQTVSDGRVMPEGYDFNTRDVAPEIKGFGGPIEMLVALNKDGSIKDISVLNHSETSEYIAGIMQPEFLNQFKGKKVGDKFIVGEDIDGITRATMSSKAVALTLKTCLERINKKEGPSEPRGRIGSDFYITVLIITFLLIAFYLKRSWLRYAGLIISILYFGFLKANFISMTNLGKIFLWNPPDLNSNLAWYVFIFSGLILTFLLGAFYCSYMCPFGGLQIFLNKVFRFNIEITPALTKNLRRTRYFLLWILSVIILALNNPNLVNYEPFSTVFLRRGSAVAWAIALMILVLSLFHYRPFCNYFCAAGAFLELISKAGRKVFRR